jgi:hypothetical protein
LKGRIIMGSSTSADTQKDTYSPDDTDDTLYIEFFATLSDIIRRVNEKWPCVSMDDIRIQPESIETSWPIHNGNVVPERTYYLRVVNLKI